MFYRPKQFRPLIANNSSDNMANKLVTFVMVRCNNESLNILEFCFAKYNSERRKWTTFKSSSRLAANVV